MRFVPAVWLLTFNIKGIERHAQLVRVGAGELVGEIIRLEGDNATIQVILLGSAQPCSDAFHKLLSPFVVLRGNLRLDRWRHRQAHQEGAA